MSSATTAQEIVQIFEPIDRDALNVLSEKGRADPTVVKTVRARTVAEGRRFRHLTYVRNLQAHVVDEPPALLGDDTAPNPTEALLAALGTCIAVGLQANAIARGWTVLGIEIESEGDINITSVWGTGDLSEKAVGLTAVRLKARLDIEGASPAELDELVAHAGQWSPVLNTVKNPVAVTLTRV